MWQQNVGKLLTQLGWGSGFRLPIANDENLALERELEKRQRLLQTKHAELEDISKHTEILERGIKNVTDHVYHDKKLILAKGTETAAEKDLLKSTEREGRKFAAEYKEIKKAFKKVKLQNEEIISMIDSRKENIAELAELVEYDRKELADLEEAASDENKFMKLIEDLSEQDSETLKKYEKRYKNASQATTSSRLELDATVAMTQVLQAELDGISIRFRKLHKDRGEIVVLWKETLDSLTNRDDDMKAIAEEYANDSLKMKEISMKLEEERNKLNDQGQSTLTAMQHLTKWDRKVSDLREAIKNVTEMNKEVKDDMFSFESAIANASNQTRQLHAKAFEIDSLISSRSEKALETLALIVELRAKIEESSNKMLSVSERTKQLNAMVDDEEKKLEMLARNLEKEMLEKGQWISKKMILSNKAKDINNEIRGAENNLMMLTTKGAELTYKLNRRQSTLYRVELKKVSLQLTFAPILNPKVHDSEKYEEEENKVVSLKADLEYVLKKKIFITAQINNLVNINRRVYKERITTEKEVTFLDAQYNDIQCYIHYIVKNLEQTVQEYQDSIVNGSLVQLKLTQLNKALKEQKNKLYDTGHQRELLEAAVKEKRSEVKVHSRLLEMKNRVLKDENSQLKMQVINVTTSMGRKRKRYELIMKLMASETSESGSVSETDEIKTEAYYVLKMAQEREILQMQGDKWDVKVKEAEVETEALQNSLAVIQCSNDLFKDSLKPLPDEEYLQAMNQLKEKEKEGIGRKNKAISNLRKMQTELQTKINAIETAQHQKVVFENRAVDKEYELRVMQGELSNQSLRSKRARMATSKLLQTLTFSGQEEKQLVSQDIKLRATRKKFEIAVQALAKLLSVQPFLYEMVGKLLFQHFGEDIAVKFIKRMSPMLGENNLSPSGSQHGIPPKFRGSTLSKNIMFRSKDRSSSAVSIASSSNVSRKKPSARPSIITGYVEEIPDRTISQRSLLTKVENLVKEDRKDSVDNKRLKKDEDSRGLRSRELSKQSFPSQKIRTSLIPQKNASSSSSESKISSSVVTVMSKHPATDKSTSSQIETLESQPKLETIPEQDDVTIAPDLKNNEKPKDSGLSFN